MKTVRWSMIGCGDAAEVKSGPGFCKALIQSIVDEMNGEGRCPSTGESAARTARVLDAILEGKRRAA